MPTSFATSLTSPGLIIAGSSRLIFQETYTERIEEAGVKEQHRLVYVIRIASMLHSTVEASSISSKHAIRVLISRRANLETVEIFWKDYHAMVGAQNMSHIAFDPSRLDFQTRWSNKQCGRTRCLVITS